MGDTVGAFEKFVVQSKSSTYHFSYKRNSTVYTESNCTLHGWDAGSFRPSPYIIHYLSYDRSCCWDLLFN